ncbi:MAG: hypothetical protein LH702_21315 [Phormidesmis sp. CAN_BIN44]|nr:hypothetical protein [Phormidesmis sp. CAN_BIN44]
MIQAAMLSPLVQTVITLASQSYGADFAAQLAPQCSLLLMHSTDDQILALLNADMKCPLHEVGRGSRQPFSPGRRESEFLSPLLLGEG